MLAVRAEETAVDGLCDVSSIQSITPEEELETLGSGN